MDWWWYTFIVWVYGKLEIAIRFFFLCMSILASLLAIVYTLTFFEPSA